MKKLDLLFKLSCCFVLLAYLSSAMICPLAKRVFAPRIVTGRLVIHNVVNGEHRFVLRLADGSGAAIRVTKEEAEKAEFGRCYQGRLDHWWPYPIDPNTTGGDPKLPPCED